jgi:hypothetical protein
MSFPKLTVHAHRRAHERYGISFAELKKFSLEIARGEATFIRGRGQKEIWIVTSGDREFPVVWDPRDKTIVTVLPKSALHELHRQIKRTSDRPLHK